MADASDAAPHKCTFTVQIDVSLEEQAFHAPSLRFRFVDGSKRQTPVVGAAGWTETPAAATTSWRYEAVIADVLITEPLASAIDDDPVVAFILSDQATAAAVGGVAAAGAGKAADPSKTRPTTATATSATAATAPLAGQSTQPTAGGSSGCGRLVADVFELDASALLAGEKLQLDQTWRSAGVAATTNNLAKNDDHNDDDDDDQSIFAQRRKATASAVTTVEAAAGRSCFTSHSGIRFVRIRISVDQPLLSVSLRKRLNPLTITVGTARRLPGVGHSHATMSGNSPHDALALRCRPVYAQWRFFPDRRLHRLSNSGNSSSSRLVVTSGRAHGETVDWQHTTTILCGRCDPAELYDALHASALTVEIHDRDLFQDEALHKLQLKWESLFTTGVDPTLPSQVQSPETVVASTSSVSSSSSSRHTTPRAQTASHQPKPLDAFAVDEIAKHDWRALVARSGESFAFGVATFRLDELLLKAKAQAQAQPPTQTQTQTHDAKPYMKLKLTSDVLARKRRAQPIGAAALAETDGAPTSIHQTLADLTPTDKLVREPGAYVVSGTTLSLHVSLQHPLPPLPPPVLAASPFSSSSSSLSAQPPSMLFSRFVLLFPYNDTATLTQLMRVIETVNKQAIANDNDTTTSGSGSGSSSSVAIRSYQMTTQQKHQCESGTLDVLTGCMVIDDDLRMVIVEGLADGAMQQVHRALPRTKPQSESFRMYANEQLRFTTRLYTAFEIDLKRIKLRYALPALLQMPDIYMRTKVAEPCYAALTKLMEMRRVSRLAEVKEMDLFPSAAMLLEVESKYGESISLDDIHGAKKTKKKNTKVKTKEKTKEKEKETETEPATNPEDDGDEEGAEGGEQRRTFKYTHWKAPTDATNRQFDETKRTRQEKDFLDERRKLVDQQQLLFRQKRQEEDAKLQADPNASKPVYLYSGQKLRSQDALQEELRTRLASDHRATYTYGPDFQSLALSLVNPDALRQNEEREARKKWTTQRGFVYPMPRATSEYYKHADAPSEARCEDLREPFVDNANHPKPVSRDSSHSQGRGAAMPEFSTLPSKDLIFGGTNGDGSVNSDYFKSVHLCGEGLRKEMDEALQREQDEWTRKLVVDKKQIRFLAHGNICSQPPSTGPQSTQLDKLRDILDGPVRSKPLRIIKNATLPSGKRVPLLPPPASIMSLQEYAGPVATTFANTLRQSTQNGAKVIDATTGKPSDFHFPSISDLLTPQVKKNTSHKPILPVRHQEKTGFLWSNHHQ